jgi:hypothetical protein
MYIIPNVEGPCLVHYVIFKSNYINKYLQCSSLEVYTKTHVTTQKQQMHPIDYVTRAPHNKVYCPSVRAFLSLLCPT